MRRPCAPKLATALFLLTAGCDADADALAEEDADRLCESAVDKLAECFGVEVTFMPCDGARAQQVIARSCGEIAEDLAQPKADDPEDWFCATFPEVCEHCGAEPSACS